MNSQLAIAHRGGSGLWPENTLEAFDRAIELGCDGIEIDVHLALDATLVVHHDERLKPAIARGADGDWLVPPTPRLKDLTLEELRQYDIGRLRPGAGYAKRYPEQTPQDGARIPTLEETILLLKEKAGPDFRLYLELKTALLSPDEGADPATLAKAAVAEVERLDFARQTVFVSFDWRALETAKRLAPHIRNAFTTLPFDLADPDRTVSPDLYAPEAKDAMRNAHLAGAPWYGTADWRESPGIDFAEKLLASMSDAQADGWFAYHADVDARTAALAADHGLEVSVWTVDEKAEMARTADLGVAAILTDRPDRLLAFLAERS